MHKLLLAVCPSAFLFLVAPSLADTIDFESGFVGSQAVGDVVTATNTVTFTVGTNTSAPGNAGTGFIAGVGGDPNGTAFQGARGRRSSYRTFHRRQLFLNGRTNQRFGDPAAELFHPVCESRRKSQPQSL